MLAGAIAEMITVTCRTSTQRHAVHRYLVIRRSSSSSRCHSDQSISVVATQRTLFALALSTLMAAGVTLKCLSMKNPPGKR